MAKASAIQRSPSDYERAYHEYRLNHFEQCLEILRKISIQDYKVLDLLAQVQFKQKKFQEAYDTYLQIMESGQDSQHTNERQENIAAIVISAQLEAPNTLRTKDMFFKQLPSVEEIIESIDILSIKDEDWFVGTKFVKKVTGKRGAAGRRAAAAAGKSIKSTNKANEFSGMDENVEPVKNKRKRHKKRKKRLPKNFDPVAGPDPERWLPKWQRSNYNARRKDKQRSQQAMIKGTQGAVSEAEAIIPKQTKVAAPVAGSSQGPRQMRPTAQKKKKKTGKR